MHDWALLLLSHNNVHRKHAHVCTDSSERKASYSAINREMYARITIQCFKKKLLLLPYSYFEASLIPFFFYILNEVVAAGV